jgi:hypothetical protein
MEELVTPTFILTFILFLIIIIPCVLYLWTLKETILACSKRNRTISPNMVWLVLIPLVGAIFYILFIIEVSNTLSKEYLMRGLPDNSRSLKKLGITLFIFQLLGAIPIVGYFFVVVGIILLIIYWVKINKSKNLILDVADLEVNFQQT